MWLQATPEIVAGQRVAALRPSEFMSILDKFVANLRTGYNRAQRIAMVKNRNDAR